MMQFNFDRSVVLGSIRTEGGDVLITRSFHSGVVQIPRSGVTYEVVSELDDSSVHVVDFGGGVPPTEAIIGVGHEDFVRTL